MSTAVFCAVEPSPESGLLPPQSTLAVPVAAAAAPDVGVLLFDDAGSEPQAASTSAALATMPTAPIGRMIFTVMSSSYPSLSDPDIRQAEWTGDRVQMNAR